MFGFPFKQSLKIFQIGSYIMQIVEAILENQDTTIHADPITIRAGGKKFKVQVTVSISDEEEGGDS